MSKTAKARNQKIRCHSEMGKMQIGGWLSGKQTYVHITSEGIVDTLGGQSLYRLAKAIVRHYENDNS